MRNNVSRIFLILIAVAFCSQLTFGQKLSKKQFNIGATAAYWLDGTVKVDGIAGDKESSFLLRVFGDYFLIPNLSMGAYFNYSPISQYGVDGTYYEIGGSIKPKFMIGKDMAIKPGVNLGYSFTTAEIDQAEVDGFGLGVSVEIQKAVDKIIIFGEIGFISMPSGGNEWVEFSFAPIFYFGGGIAF